MKIEEEYSVRKIFSKEAYPFLLKIHYAKRIPNIMYAFGLFFENKMVGVITFGLPPSPSLQVQFGNDFNFVELNRLCLLKQFKRNVLSYFVSKSLNLLPKNSVIVSYSDIDYNHSGYIYQATNWVYTGIGSVGVKRFVMKDGSERHSRHKHLIKEWEVDEVLLSVGKHRYFYFVGDKRSKRLFMKKLEHYYEILDYPKDKNELYEIKSEGFDIQKTLF